MDPNFHAQLEHLNEMLKCAKALHKDAENNLGFLVSFLSQGMDTEEEAQEVFDLIPESKHWQEFLIPLGARRESL